MDTIAGNDAIPAEIRRDLLRLADLLVRPRRDLREGLAQVGSADRMRSITDWLYGSWYTHQAEGGHSNPAGQPPPNLRSALDAATAASRRWQRGWVVLHADPTGVCLAGLAQIKRRLLPIQYANISRPGLPPLPGDMLSANASVSDYDATTGFWLSQSAAGAPTPPLARLYFNVGWHRVGQVVEEVTSWLEQAGALYSLKYPAAPEATRRIDTLVVYLERSRWQEMHATAVVLARRLEQHLRPATPPLTRRLAAGAACADDPGAGESFGQNRCRALAPAVLDLLAHGGTRPDAAFVELTKALETASIDPRRPWHVSPD
jgi:HopA1 effector protein family